MSIRVRRWFAIGSFLLAAPLSAEEDPSCRAYLVPCNIGQHCSGTLRWKSVLASPGERVTGEMAVRVVRGEAECEGSVTTTGPNASTESIRGKGLLVVEWGTGTDDDPEEPWYRIAVACPDVDGRAPTEISGAVETYKRPRRTGFASFEGVIAEEHPDADPVNGVTGTWNLEWSLARER